MKRIRLVYGIYFIIAAILLLLSAVGVIDNIPAIKLAVPILLAPIFIIGVAERGFLRIILPISLTFVTFSKELGITGISPWTVVIASVFLAVGLNTLLPKRKLFKKKMSKTEGIFNNSDPDNIKISSRFGGVEKYIESGNFTSAVIDCSYSGISLFLERAVMNPDGATVFIDAKCSGIELCVPASWQVVDKLACSMSGVNIPVTAEKPLKLTLEGNVSLCGVTVKYI